MLLEKQMLVTLSDKKEYIVLSTVEINSVNYIYLIENNNISNIKFCTQEIENEKIKLIEVEEIELRKTLLKEFTNKMKTEMQNV